MFIYEIVRAQTAMKGRLKGAQKGHRLLKRKADALTVRFRGILRQIIEVYVCLELLTLIRLNKQWEK